MKLVVTLLGLPALVLGLAAAALAQSFSVFDAPNASYTYSFSVNAGGDVTGYFGDTSQGKDRGFVRDRNGNFLIQAAKSAGAIFAREACHGESGHGGGALGCAEEMLGDWAPGGRGGDQAPGSQT